MLKRTIVVLLILAVAAFFAFAEDGGHAYQGTKKCSMCHKGDKKGNMKEIWEESPHAHAYQTLVDAGEHENPECLRCHVTGYGEPAEMTEAVEMENGITCEACHGPGADYGKMSVMRDHDASVAAGMVANPEEHCTDCHNEESPTYKPFDYDTFWEEIKHSIPE